MENFGCINRRKDSNRYNNSIDFNPSIPFLFHFFWIWKLGLADFDACFDLDAKVQQVAKDMVAKLKAQDCDLIIAIAHMDGYYSKSQLQDDSRWELDTGVEPNDQGVDKVLFSGIFNLMMKMQIFDEY